jgi:hypothetical protein
VQGYRPCSHEVEMINKIIVKIDKSPCLLYASSAVRIHHKQIITGWSLEKGITEEVGLKKHASRF